MAVVTKRADMSARVFGRAVVFDSGAGDFGAGDTVDVEYSLGGPAISVVVETAGAGGCTFRLNSMNRRYPLFTAAKDLGFPAPDLQNEAIWYDPNAREYVLGAGEEFNVPGPVANLQFTVVTGTVTVTIRS